MKNYLAITIGPIYHTLQQARKTRELWAASYLFSRLTELLIEEVARAPLSATVLLPTKIGQADAKEKYGAGIYNDRLYARLDHAPQQGQIESVIDAAVRQLATELTPSGETTDQGYWRKMLRIEWVCKPLDNLDQGGLFAGLNHFLDVAELHTPYFQTVVEPDTLTRLLTRVYETPIAKKNTATGKGNIQRFVIRL